MIEIDRGDTIWRFDDEFLASNWTCVFGRGCQGILDRPAEDLNQGCCSLGAHFGDGDDGRAEARQISAYAAAIPPELWQFGNLGSSTDAIFGDADRTHTRIVDGACIFLNRPGFSGGEGCALHLAALDAGESPIEWKPSVCWQLPLHVDFAPADPADPDGPEIATVVRWGRTEWGEHGTTMAWCCTERANGGEAFCGDLPVVASLREELVAITGDDVYREMRSRLGVDDPA